MVYKIKFAKIQSNQQKFLKTKTAANIYSNFKKKKMPNKYPYKSKSHKIHNGQRKTIHNGHQKKQNYLKTILNPKRLTN